ncbi:substrate-binding domain-containing protein [Patulibacter sp. SYSU D01012]|uniref:substrate-binding domain-containing protein n=1 Tax=Patulibacter sp. SYSU D01012 TaxID=2817381 RepID=UPI001B30EAAF|nr:substrate-binding domain-containing protein [Patulibacter sp. SYSU D01012]
MFIHKLLAGSAAVVLAGSLGACSASTDNPADASSSSGSSKGGERVIGFSNVTLQSPFYVGVRDAVEKEAKARGVKLVFLDANGDVAKQNRDLQDLQTRGVDGVLVNPVNPEAVKPSVDGLVKQDVPVVTVDRPVTSGATAHVGRDNVAMGRLVGEQAKKDLGAAGGKIVELQGDAGGDVMRDRRDGFEGVFQGDAKVKVVRGPYSEYIRANAIKAMQDLLQANKDLKAVYAHNDDMALGAVKVLKDNGLEGKVKVYGIDGLMEAVKQIPSGHYQATALNDPATLGKLALDTLLKKLDGQDVPKDVDAGTTLVTKANADQFIGDSTFAAYDPKGTR